MKLHWPALWLLAVAVFGLAGCSDDSGVAEDEAVASSVGPPIAGVFDDAREFRVRLEYPGSWERDLDYDLRFGGEDGFVSMVAQEGPGGLDGAAAAIVAHKLQPYGSNPTIEAVTVEGADGRIIRPSADQHPGLRGQVALVLLRDPPLSVRGETYSYLVIEADGAHFSQILSSISLLD